MKFFKKKAAANQASAFIGSKNCQRRRCKTVAFNIEKSKTNQNQKQ